MLIFGSIWAQSTIPYDDGVKFNNKNLNISLQGLN